MFFSVVAPALTWALQHARNLFLINGIFFALFEKKAPSYFVGSNTSHDLFHQRDDNARIIHQPSRWWWQNLQRRQ
jgi:hypothetical protein